jgi:PIN domain nuclease of toxin-antitoxin system
MFRTGCASAGPLIAQAQLDSLTILTCDKVFEYYDVEIHWAE